MLQTTQREQSQDHVVSQALRKHTYFKVGSLDYTFSHTSPHNWHSIWINPIMSWKALYKTFQLTSMWVISEWRNVLKTVSKTLCWRIVAFKGYDVAVKTQLLYFCSIRFAIIKLQQSQNKVCDLTVTWLKQHNEKWMEPQWCHSWICVLQIWS